MESSESSINELQLSYTALRDRLSGTEEICQSTSEDPSPAEVRCFSINESEEQAQRRLESHGYNPDKKTMDTDSSPDSSCALPREITPTCVDRALH